MANGQEESPATSEGVATAQGLLDTAFSKLKELGAGDESSRLFPNGIESVDLVIGLGAEDKPELRMALKIAGASVATTIESTESAEAEEEFSLSFNKEGHKVIAVLAMKDLEERSPTARERVQQILDDGNRSVKEAAEFPDVIRNQQPQTKPFHFVDIPLKQGGPLNPPLPDAPHVLSMIEEFSNFLRSGDGNAEKKVDVLSWIFHLFGDVHQPMHCIERTNQHNPGGDRGGNGFRLKGTPNNLHSLWDSSITIFSTTDIEDLADEIMEEHSRESLATDLEVTDPERWARNGFRLAKQNAYTLVENPNNPPKPSMTYLKRMSRIGHKQAALGGYRLSDRLKEIFE